MNGSPSSGQRLLLALSLFIVLFGTGAALQIALYPELIWPKTEEPKQAKVLKEENAEPEPLPPVEFFPGLTKPEIVLMVSGQTYGYLQPCGCSRPQLGGFERRFELKKELEAKGWTVESIDLGDLAAKSLNEQAKIKFETALQALNKMSTIALGLGINELTFPAIESLAYALNYQPPKVLAANFDEAGAFAGMFEKWTVKETGPFKVAYIGLIADSVSAAAKAKQSELTFRPAEESLSEALGQLKADKPDFTIVLLQGTREEGKALAARFQQIDLMLTLDDAEEPSSLARLEGNTMLVSTGHKGRYIGLVGVFRDSNGSPELKYQLADLSEHYELPDDQTNPAREHMKDYVLRVYQEKFLEQYPKRTHPLQFDHPEAKFAGAESCKDCHKPAYKVWAGSKHSHAYESLVKYGRPRVKVTENGRDKLIGREYDPECIACHSTGFEYNSGFVNEATSPHLMANGCENCHGPASLHVAKPDDFQLRQALHLNKASVEQACRKCHDGDNDPKFDFNANWEKIKHPE